MILQLLLLLSLIPCKVGGARCPSTVTMDEIGPLNCFRPGDHLITGLVSVIFTSLPSQTFREPPFAKGWRRAEEEWHLLSFSLAIEEISQNLRLLPSNVTLGYTVHDNTAHPREMYNTVPDLIPSAQEAITNCECGGWNNLVAALEGSLFEISIDVSTFLSTFRVPQV
uniref:Uncharacterized protein n=1 Tax=Sphaerodactylus townsendi TaxID=933632 RepID=A0ACB8EEW4_9SAUR